MCVAGSIGNVSGGVKATDGVSPMNRVPTKAAKCEVWKTSFSTPAIAIMGNTAQSNVARRAQPETSSQPAVHWRGPKRMGGKKMVEEQQPHLDNRQLCP